MALPGSVLEVVSSTSVDSLGLPVVVSTSRGVVRMEVGVVVMVEGNSEMTRNSWFKTKCNTVFLLCENRMC